MNIKEIALGRRDMFMIDPRILVEKPGFNLREEGPELEEYIATLAEYTKENGVPGILEINIEGEEVVVIDGHCRRRAAIIAINQGAEIKAVKCMMSEKGASEADRVARLVTSNSGRPLSPIEKAGVVKRLRDFGLENKDISKKLGMTVSYVGQLLELAGAPEFVAEMVKAGEVSASTAMQEVKANPSTAKERLKDAVKVAKAAGKKKATKKHIAPTLAEKAKKKKQMDLLHVTRIKEMIDDLNKEKLIEVKKYIEFRLKKK